MCYVCHRTPFMCMTLRNLRAYFCVTPRLCSPVALSVRRCCLDKQTGRAVPDNSSGPAWGPLTVTLICNTTGAAERGVRHDHCILNVSLCVYYYWWIQNCGKVGFGVIAVFWKVWVDFFQFSYCGRGRWSDGSPPSSHPGDLKHSPVNDCVCLSAVYQKWCQISLRKQILPTDCHSVSERGWMLFDYDSFYLPTPDAQHKLTPVSGQQREWAWPSLIYFTQSHHKGTVGLPSPPISHTHPSPLGLSFSSPTPHCPALTPPVAHTQPVTLEKTHAQRRARIKRSWLVINGASLYLHQDRVHGVCVHAERRCQSCRVCPGPPSSVLPMCSL